MTIDLSILGLCLQFWMSKCIKWNAMYWFHYNKNSAISLPLENSNGHPVVGRYVKQIKTMKRHEKLLSNKIREANGMPNWVLNFI